MNIDFKKIILAGLVLFLIGFGYKLFFRKNPESGLKKQPLTCVNCNLVFIAYDALQANHVTHLGYPKQTTPVLDALAAKGYSFSNAFSAAPWTVPSYMSIFTGLYPTEHKLVNKYEVYTTDKQIISNLKKLSPQIQTLAEVLKNNGYSTGGFTGDAGVHSMFGYNQGFEVYTDEKSFGSVENSGEHALSWIKENKDKKFFIFLHGYDSHGQFKTEENYKGKFLPANYHGQYKGTTQEQANLREEGLANGELNLSQEDVDFWRGMYDSKIYDADKRVGNFLDEFNKIQTINKTIFVIFADHGTEVFEHKRVDHGFSLYDELLHVPLVFVIPGMTGGERINNQVSTIDITPTIIDLLGIVPNDQFKSQIRGASLIPLLENKKMNSKDVFSETDYRDYTHQRSIRTGDGWKFIITLENGKKELYNLQTDPEEKNNLVNSEPKKASDLYELLKNHLTQMGSNIEGSWTTGCLPVYGDQCKLEQKEIKRPTKQIQEYF